MQKEEKECQTPLNPREEKKKALGISIKEGCFASTSSNLGDLFITPLAVEITPQANQGIVVGLLSSFTSLISQFAQLKGSKLIKTHPRKSIVLFFIFIQACLWLPIAGLSLLAWKGYLTGYLPIALIILYSLIAITSGLVHPSWFSWMGDIVPEKIRGRYFGKRNLTVGIIGLVVALLGGLFMRYMREEGFLLIGFSILFFLAFVFRMISRALLSTQYAPPGGYKKERTLPFKEFVKTYKNFTKFSVYYALFNFAIMVASPFFSLYMLEELGLKNNYLMYMILSVSSTAFYLLFLPLTGKFSDKYGNLKLLYIANIAFILTPILWTFSKNSLYLLLVPQLSSGIGNAALVIAVTNFTYSSISNHHRGIGVAYSNIMMGIGTFVGAILGGLILNYVEITFINKFFFIFILASGLRLLVALFFLPKLKEAKLKVHHLHYSVIHPFRAVNTEMHNFYKSSEKSYERGLNIWKTPGQYRR